MGSEEYRIMFSGPASVELQAVFLDILSKKGPEAAENEISVILAGLEKLQKNPFLGFDVPRGRPAVQNGRMVARRGLRLFQTGKYLAYYKVSQSDVNIYHIFERGTRYLNIAERDLQGE